MVPMCILIVPSYGTPLQSCSNFKKKKIRRELLYQLYARVGNQELVENSEDLGSGIRDPGSESKNRSVKKRALLE